ncbi:MAG: hypothetical protein M1817_001561 [Caeruleum heppii]|nr:MAG: hypothetical protein M1817_001561 [Caeruleum heppii]
MTIFVVSLFLPFTVNFVVPTPQRRPSPPRRQTTRAVNPSQDGTSSVPSLFTGSGPTPPMTPAIGDHEEFFAQEKVPEKMLPKIMVEEPQSLARSDPHSPAWGTGQSFNQPPSRAGQPPSPSILKRTKIHAKLNSWRTGAKETLLGGQSPRDRSHERAFTKAEWSIEPAEQGNGGLRNAVRAGVDAGDLGDDTTWVGTLGMPTDVLEDSQKEDIQDRLENEFSSLNIWCSDGDVDGHYNHFCKQIPDNPKSKAYEDHSWVYYVKVNQIFADKIVRNYKRGDVIWIHDYHLLLVPNMVRQKLKDAKIGFFLHVAFPSSEVFRCLAVRKELLEGMLGSNLVGFQTEEYCRHFLQTCSRLLNVEATNEGVQLEERFVNVANFAIGVDPASLEKSLEGASVAQWLAEIQERYAGKRLIVARDKLDHVRGVRQKLLAYELFLNKYPQFREKVATSTTEQAELDATVSDIVTRVNSTHATLAHQPLVFLKQDISFAQYLALITVADALMITSLREGMNLTSHEFIFCQSGKYSKQKHGSLILSEFTGSASVFGGSELSVNPWDYRKCAEAVRIALEMEPAEREQRWQKLHDVVMHHTAASWFANFLDRLSHVYEEQHARDTISIPRLSINTLTQKYLKSSRRIFILDYEGTLASWGSPSSIILTSPQRVLDVLNDILLDTKNIVYVMSGRQPEELDRLFGRVPKLGMIAENGCFVKEFGATEWIDVARSEEMTPWKKSVRHIMDYYQERTEGSWLEERHCSLLLHYGSAADSHGAAVQAGECANHINEACESQRVHAIPLERAVLVEPMDWSKGTAATQILEGLRSKHDDRVKEEMPDFLMVAGDDRDDEAIFQWANQLAADKVVEHVTTVSVGSRNTQAMATLTQGVTGKS